MNRWIGKLLIAIGLAIACACSSAGTLVPLSYGGGYNSSDQSFEFFVKFDRTPEFFDAGGDRVDDLRFWLNSVYGINAFHTALETYVPGLPRLGITSMLAVTGEGALSLIRIDGTSPELLGWRATLVRDLPYTVSADDTLRFTVARDDLGDDDGAISTIFETYRLNSQSSGMIVLQVPEPPPLLAWLIGLLFLATTKWQAGARATLRCA